MQQRCQMIRYRLTRTVTMKECPWLYQTRRKGEVVYRYYGCTYGCVSDGIAVTKKPDNMPFFELPYDALEGE